MGLFKTLTTDEADILVAHLHSGASKQMRVTHDHATVKDTHEVITAIQSDRRDRWNAENPDYKL